MKSQGRILKKVLFVFVLLAILWLVFAPKNVIKDEDLDRRSELADEDVICYIENAFITKYTRTLKVSITNHGEEPFGYRPGLRIEKYHEGSWYLVPLLELADEHTLDVPSAVPPGETETAMVYLGKEYPALSKGMYRLIVGEDPLLPVYFQVH